MSYIFFNPKTEKKSMRWEKSMRVLGINRDIFLSGLIEILKDSCLSVICFLCICEQLRKSRGTRQKISKRKHVSTCSKQFDWVEKLHDQLWIQKGILISKEKLCDWLKTQAMAYKNKEQYDFFFMILLLNLTLMSTVTRNKSVHS